MNKSVNLCKRHRFPPAIIQYAVWLYRRFNPSHRDIEDLLAERGIEVSYESVRLFGDTFFIDEVFITITSQRYYLWRAVDQDGDVCVSTDTARRQGGQTILPAAAQISRRKTLEDRDR